MTATLNLFLAYSPNVTVGSKALWDVWDGQCRYLETKLNGWYVLCVYNIYTFKILEINLCHSKSEEAYRWIFPKLKKKYKKEALKRGVNWKNAYDHVEYVDLTVKQIFKRIEKLSEILVNED